MEQFDTYLVSSIISSHMHMSHVIKVSPLIGRESAMKGQLFSDVPFISRRCETSSHVSYYKQGRCGVWGVTLRLPL